MRVHFQKNLLKDGAIFEKLGAIKLQGKIFEYGDAMFEIFKKKKYLLLISSKTKNILVIILTQTNKIQSVYLLSLSDKNRVFFFFNFQVMDTNLTLILWPAE